MGLYRFRLDNQDMNSSIETQETSFIPAVELTEGLHTLFVQERDSVGNWSPASRWPIRIDLSAPSEPKLRVFPASPTNNPRPLWSWTAVGSGGMGRYRYRLGSSDLANAPETSGVSFTPQQDLHEGEYILYLQERDSAGNWSLAASRTIRIDRTPPAPPNVMSKNNRTTNLRPSWSWSSGENGDRGIFRYMLDDTTLQTGGTSTSGTNYTPEIDLTVSASHTLYVQEGDSAGNWSTMVSVPFGYMVLPDTPLVTRMLRPIVESY